MTPGRAPPPRGPDALGVTHIERKGTAGRLPLQLKFRKLTLPVSARSFESVQQRQSPHHLDVVGVTGVGLCGESDCELLCDLGALSGNKEHVVGVLNHAFGID